MLISFCIWIALYMDSIMCLCGCGFLKVPFRGKFSIRCKSCFRGEFCLSPKILLEADIWQPQKVVSSWKGRLRGTTFWRRKSFATNTFSHAYFVLNSLKVAKSNGDAFGPFEASKNPLLEVFYVVVICPVVFKNKSLAHGFRGSLFCCRHYWTIFDKIATVFFIVSRPWAPPHHNSITWIR